MILPGFSPSAPALPPAPPPPPKIDDPAIAAAARKQRLADLRRKGRASMNITGGLTDDPLLLSQPSATPTLGS
jgi:hypothetical protein